MIPQHLKGKKVVVETDSPYTIVGELVEEKDGYLILDQVDMHDRRMANTHQDIYLSDVSHNGIQVNRKKVNILMSRVVCISDLDDVVSY